MTIPAKKHNNSRRVGLQWLIVTVFVLIMGIIVGSFYAMLPTATDKKEYDILVNASQAARQSESALSPYVARQGRVDVRKDIFFTEKEGRVRFELLSADAELVFNQNEEKLQIIENMNDVQCYMQEELFFLLPDGREVSKTKEGLFYLKGKDPLQNEAHVETEETLLQPMQLVRTLEAKRASYNYSTDLFVARHATIAQYLLPGHQFTGNTINAKQLMNGIAQKVEFSLAGETINFKAYQLKAQFHPTESF